MEEIEGYFQRTLKRQVLGNVQPSHQGTSAFPLTIHDHPPSFPDKKIKENSAEPNQVYNNY